jgi:hypothetical protein
MAQIIEQGLERDLLHGSVLAWKFMVANGVPEPLIVRVLADPARRRCSDPAPPPAAPLSSADQSGTASSS